MVCKKKKKIFFFVFFCIFTSGRFCLTPGSAGVMPHFREAPGWSGRVHMYAIFLKLCTCFLHGLKMCMWFGYNPCIYFCYFFHFANFVIFWPQILWKCCDSGYLVSATPHTILYWSFWNFVHVFAMVWRCAYGLDIILELIFVTFSTLWTLSFSDLRFYESLETVGTLWAQLLTQIFTDLYETLHMFLPWSGDVHLVWI